MRPRAFVCCLCLALSAAGLRAQITEWPMTVKPGRFMLEMDALTLTVDREPGYKYTAVGAASTFLTTGLTDHWDVQVGAELFLSQKLDEGGLGERDSGIGDIYLRTKYRFYENTATGTAAAILPYVKIPTNTGGVGNDALEGGIIVPWTTGLAGGFSLYAMAELDFLRNDADDGYDTYWYASAALNRSLTGLLGVYGELTLGKSSGGSAFEGQMGAGLTVSLSDTTWWDVAFYKGFSSGANDWTQVVRFNYGF